MKNHIIRIAIASLFSLVAVCGLTSCSTTPSAAVLSVPVGEIAAYSNYQRLTSRMTMRDRKPFHANIVDASDGKVYRCYVETGRGIIWGNRYFVNVPDYKVPVQVQAKALDLIANENAHRDYVPPPQYEETHPGSGVWMNWGSLQQVKVQKSAALHRSGVVMKSSKTASR